MCDKMNKCNHDPSRSMDETLDEAQAHRVYSGNSQAASRDHFEGENHLVERSGELLHLHLANHISSRSLG